MIYLLKIASFHGYGKLPEGDWCGLFTNLELEVSPLCGCWIFSSESNGQIVFLLWVLKDAQHFGWFKVQWLSYKFIAIMLRNNRISIICGYHSAREMPASATAEAAVCAEIEQRLLAPYPKHPLKFGHMLDWGGHFAAHWCCKDAMGATVAHPFGHQWFNISAGHLDTAARGQANLHCDFHWFSLGATGLCVVCKNHIFHICCTSVLVCLFQWL